MLLVSLSVVTQNNIFLSVKSVQKWFNHQIFFFSNQHKFVVYSAISCENNCPTSSSPLLSLASVQTVVLQENLLCQTLSIESTPGPRRNEPLTKTPCTVKNGEFFFSSLNKLHYAEKVINFNIFNVDDFFWLKDVDVFFLCHQLVQRRSIKTDLLLLFSICLNTRP